MTKRIGDLLTAIAFGVLFVICLSFVTIRVSGLGSYVVTGGSMEPQVHKGSLVLVQPVSPSEVKVGDVITFQQYDQTTTHRVIAIAQDARGLVFKTKGDANSVADPEDKTFPGAVGIVRGTLPVAGYIAAGAQAYWRLLLTLVAAAIFFSCAGVLVFRSETTTAGTRKRSQTAVRRLAPVIIDPDAAWRAHLDWLERSRMRAAWLAS
jgi:signal peptidase